MRAADDVELRSEIEQFLYREAWLLDQGGSTVAVSTPTRRTGYRCRRTRPIR